LSKVGTAISIQTRLDLVEMEVNSVGNPTLRSIHVSHLELTPVADPIRIGLPFGLHGRPLSWEVNLKPRQRPLSKRLPISGPLCFGENLQTGARPISIGPPRRAFLRLVLAGQKNLFEG
jgi:hypothetical protein